MLSLASAHHFRGSLLPRVTSATGPSPQLPHLAPFPGLTAQGMVTMSLFSYLALGGRAVFTSQNKTKQKQNDLASTTLNLAVVG